MVRPSLIAASALLVAGCDRERPEAAQESAAVAVETAEAGAIDRSRAGTLAPSVPLSDPDGAQANLAAMQGTPLLVNLWATWCAPCVTEMPLLDAVAEDYAGRLRVVTVSQDLNGAEAVAPFFAERDLENLTRWLDPENRAMETLEANALPLTVLYDAEGREVWRVAGDRDWSDARSREAIETAIAG